MSDTIFSLISNGFFFFLYAIIYLIEVYPLYIMACKANVKNKWIMFIPVFNMFKLYHIAGFSYWYVILSLVPIFGWIIPIIMLYKVFKNFNVGTFGSILGVVFSFIGFWYLALSKNVRFTGDIPSRFKEI